MLNDEQQSEPQVPIVTPSAEPTVTVTSEPPTQRFDTLLGQPTATNLEERPITALPHDELAGSDGRPIAHAFILQPKRNVALPIAIGGIVAVLVMAAITLGVYYNSIA